MHIELQSWEESDFTKRMNVSNQRLFDYSDCDVASVAVFGDERPNWRPNQFERELWGTKASLQFRVIKLLDDGVEWETLEASTNPFALVVMAHLKTHATCHDLLSWSVRWKSYGS